MIRQNVNLSALMPIGRTKAAEIAGVAGKYTCMLTLERDGIVLNLKSMIGLLSQTVPADGEMVLVAQGADEQEACKAMVEVLG
ncbi:MAG: HPr family phosphocarrier protein [Clostridia bacterium]|nr:HPr family phosphocarrier protein [Clostridia bacterium]